jgi:folate-dependent phosphoribosylglycinamide formyltransferase PurN
MRIVIITDKGLMHKHLCVRLAGEHNVVGILHSSQPQRKRSVRSLIAEVRARSLVGTVLHKLGNRSLVGWSRKHAVQRAQRRFFADTAEAYSRLAHDAARDVANINSPESVGLVRGLRPDVTICLGGPVYRDQLLEASPLTLNYHTGISPIYNGSGTIFWTFANKHFHLIGGTLMVMNKIVDGGDILAHYLCDIAADDDPGSLLMKAVDGGATLYDRFLSHLEHGGEFARVRQPKPFFNYRNADWTIYQNLAVQRSIELGACARFQRSAEMIEYWRSENDQTARQALRDNVVRWLCDFS